MTPRFELTLELNELRAANSKGAFPDPRPGRAGGSGTVRAAEGGWNESSLATLNWCSATVPRQEDSRSMRVYLLRHAGSPEGTQRSGVQ